MFAVIKTGGKQYRVAANDTIKVEKISAEPGDLVELGEVLMVSGEKGVEIGNPRLAGITVAAEVLGHDRGDTIIIFKKRRRHHYRRRNGHRQSFTELKITEILTDGRKPQRKEATPQPAPAEAAAPAEAQSDAAREGASEKKPARKASARRAAKVEAATKPKSPARSKPKKS